ncbi:hypothetical protein [Vreelandella sulfidaeris]|nr:hypothetical protein [Halomonas sulfidaeris]
MHFRSGYRCEALEPLRCNQQESLLNPHFIVCGQRDSRWENALNKTAAPN